MEHICIRIYPNGSAKYTVRDDAGLLSWLEYNRQYRGGNSLFVDGEHVEGTGSLHGEDLEHVARHVLAVDLPNTKLRPLGRMWDSDMGEFRVRYADDDDLVHGWEAEEFMEEIFERNNVARPR
ncbi:hypothetical protein [Rhizobium leguminosarum]|uniref:hypothetical protein n=1 Tax=Rhizobium leguminosarum TaxID=384 RepID=UPI002E1544A6|nr:hypothetical protein U8Q02_41490 [Rhizobium leguminosarum]